MSRDAAPRRCHHCQGPTTEGAARQFGGRFCSEGCEKAHTHAHHDHHNKLVAEGFIHSADTPNLYTKDGVSLTLEEVKHVGLAKALATHRNVVRNPKLRVRTDE